MKPTTSEPAAVRIRVRGRIARRWEPWLDGMAIGPGTRVGETELTGCVADQAALLELLQKLANLGLMLLEIAVDTGEAAPAGAMENEEG